MSYHFEVSAATRDEAKRRVAEQMDRIVKDQTLHTHDRQAAVAAAGAYIDLCPDPSEDEVLFVTCSGTLGWQGQRRPRADPLGRRQRFGRHDRQA